MPDEDPEIDLKSKKKVSFLELVSSIKCLFPGKEKFNGKIKSLQFYHENHTKPQEKGANKKSRRCRSGHNKEICLPTVNRLLIETGGT